ncbi:putative porin [Stenotrophomonas mori]|uniref:Porin n=1 Tax=Stenotrophomonas mori TaxID=2871096 RepID=A0ABT0SKN0_9GAMM|nr:putative porin [Stenotrophomonas mori]MCL7715886.1 putative porin [Stenotrophomonas mori]
MNPSIPPVRPARSLLLLALLAAGIAPAYAQQDGDHAALLEQVAQLRAQQAQLARMQQDNEAALRTLESRLGVAAVPAMAPPAAPAAAPVAPASAPAAPATTASALSRLTVSGDMRVRSQFENSNDNARDRTSGQVRGRLAAAFAVNDRISIGARLVTGNPDDPRSTDVQLSNWDNDLEVSLDQAWLKLAFGALDVHAGKIPQPFTRTELVWDGDVNPQGLSANWKHALADGGGLRANGLFFVIDEQATGGDSTMVGAQVGYDSPALGDWRFDASAAHYRYSIGSTVGATATDWRSNLLNPDGSYVSGFHLNDVILGASYSGWGERWPLRIVGDYVHNSAARTDADSGYGVDLLLGRAQQPGDWRVSYGHSMAEVDAVLTAFSHDNIGLASNYRMHAFGVDYVPWPKTTLSALWYRYRPLSARYAGSADPGDWLNRFRVALMVSF